MAEYLAADKKQEIFAKYGKSNTDTGRLLDYLKVKDIERYREIVKALNLRK